MKINIFTAEEIYLTGFDYSFIKNTRISDENIIQIAQISKIKH